VIWVALWACGSRPAARELANTAPQSEPAPKRDPLALAKGATFHYEVSIDTGGGVHRFPWTMTVVDVIEGNGVTLYKISGWPEQLADVDVDPATPPAPKLRNLINAYDNFVWGDSTANVAGTRWFTWPLFDGQRICPDPNVRYCWTVSVERGLYRLTMVTNPDDETFELTPGVGLTRFAYHHHGTPLSVEAKLVR
jgi:hypothetical protein